jgi:hypothetical protein
VDLGQSTSIGTLVFYEWYNPSPSDGCFSPLGGGICLDTIIIEVSNTGSPDWTLVFNWGDNDFNNNGANIQSYHWTQYNPWAEADNEIIPAVELYSLIPYPGAVNYGILIPVDGIYRYVRFTAPPWCGDYTQVDAIEILEEVITATPAP